MTVSGHAKTRHGCPPGSDIRPKIRPVWLRLSHEVNSMVKYDTARTLGFGERGVYGSEVEPHRRASGSPNPPAAERRDDVLADE